jgi:hypothetical protein
MCEAQPAYLAYVSDADYSVGNLRPKAVLEMMGAVAMPLAWLLGPMLELLRESEPSMARVPL